MISKEKLLRGYIRNDIKQGGELFNKWKEACLLYEFGTKWMSSSVEEALKDVEVCYIDRFGDFNGAKVLAYFEMNAPDYVELTLEDFEEEGEELQKLNERLEVKEEAFTIPWDQIPEGYDYWIVETGSSLSEGSFHKKRGLTYEDQCGFYWEIGYEGYHYQVYTKPDNTLPEEKQDTVESLKAAMEGSEVKNYKYTPVEVESIFDLRNMFEDGELYFEDANQGDDQGMVGITDEGTLTALLAYQDTIYTRKEVKWQDEVLAYLNKPSEEGFEEELPSKFRVDYMDSSFHLVDSEFLEMCRVALRASGELK